MTWRSITFESTFSSFHFTIEIIITKIGIWVCRTVCNQFNDFISVQILLFFDIAIYRLRNGL